MATYAVTDLHGQYELYEQIKKFLKPEDKVFFLGDANDRGPEGWRLIKAIATDPQFVYLKGNHEDLLVKAGREILREEFHGEWTRELMNNGGYATLTWWQNEEERFQADWLNYLDKLPEYYVHQNVYGLIIILSHAGCTPIVNENNELCITTNLIWDRKHFTDDWSKNCDDILVVHGHTPNCFVHEFLNPEVRDAEVSLGAYWYCGGHKVCLDTGAFWTNTTVLLDLDTFDEHIFQGEDKE